MASGSRFMGEEQLRFYRFWVCPAIKATIFAKTLEKSPIFPLLSASPFQCWFLVRLHSAGGGGAGARKKERGEVSSDIFCMFKGIESI